MEREHAHPLTIFANLWRVLYLVIIPVLRGFVNALQGDLNKWIGGAWIDILIVLLMVGIAVWRWWAITFVCDDGALHVYRGIISRQYMRIAWSSVVTLSLVESFYLRPFRAVHFRADTLGGGRDPDFAMLLSLRRGRAILSRYGKEGAGQIHRGYIPSTASILALAFLTSNSLGGILFMATFISQMGRLLGNEFSQIIVGTFEEATRLLAFGIPPAAAAIAYVLLSGWLIGFLLTFVRYKNFSVSRRPGRLNISGGIFTRREYAIRYERINFIDIRQSVITKATKLYSLYISAVGYGKQRDDINCLIPTERAKHFRANCALLFPSFRPTPRQIYPRITGVMRFIGPALTWCGGILLALVVLLWRFPRWSQFILFVCLMAMVPALYMVVVRLMDFATGGISVHGDVYTIRYSKGFIIHTVIVPREKIVKVSLKQGFFQKFGKNCDLILYTTAELRAAHHCRSLNKKALQLLFSIDE